MTDRPIQPETLLALARDWLDDPTGDPDRVEPLARGVIALVAELAQVKSERDALFEEGAMKHDEERPIRTKARLQAARIAELEQGLREACDDWYGLLTAGDRWDPTDEDRIAALRALVEGK